MKKFKVSFSYPLEHPIKVIIKKIGLLGIIAWFLQKYGQTVDTDNVVVSERIIELPTLHHWLGSLFPRPSGKLLEVGHVASSVALELSSMGYSVTGIDLRDYPFSHNNLISIQGDFLKHSFRDKFDCIYSLSTIEHFGFSVRYGGEDDVNSQDEEAFEKISGLLTPNGRAIVSFPYAKKWIPNIGYRVYTRDGIGNKLKKCFEIEEERYYCRSNGNWNIVENPNDDPSFPNDGVVLFKLIKRAEQ